jgi:hypothetical protein
MQSLLFPIQFAFVSVPVQSLLFISLIEETFTFLKKASLGVSFLWEHLLL